MNAAYRQPRTSQNTRPVELSWSGTRRRRNPSVEGKVSVSRSPTTRWWKKRWRRRLIYKNELDLIKKHEIYIELESFCSCCFCASSANVCGIRIFCSLRCHTSERRAIRIQIMGKEKRVGGNIARTVCDFHFEERLGAISRAFKLIGGFQHVLNFWLFWTFLISTIFSIVNPSRPSLKFPPPPLARICTQQTPPMV